MSPVARGEDPRSDGQGTREADMVVASHDFSCGFGGHEVLRNLTFHLRRDRTTAIVGPGGSGKTTLLRLLAGEPPPVSNFWTRGHLGRRFPSPPLTLAQGARETALSLLDELAAPGRSSASCCARALAPWSHEPAAQLLVLAALDLPPRTLPDPLRRLTAVTACLTKIAGSASPVLLADEPAANLEGSFVDWVAGQILRLRGKATVVLATHRLDLARRLSDDMLLLVRGQLVESGPTERLFTEPRHQRTRDFVLLGS